MVKIRLQKLGRRNRAYFRIVVTDVRVKRQGEYLEKLGQYDPVESDTAKQLHVNGERLKHWIEHGAQATDAVVNLLRKRGIYINDPKGLTIPATPAPAAPAAPAK